MSSNEFGVEENNSGGFFSGSEDFDSMFDDASNASVEDAEVETTARIFPREEEEDYRAPEPQQNVVEPEPIEEETTQQFFDDVQVDDEEDEDSTGELDLNSFFNKPVSPEENFQNVEEDNSEETLSDFSVPDSTIDYNSDDDNLDEFNFDDPESGLGNMESFSDPIRSPEPEPIFGENHSDNQEKVVTETVREESIFEQNVEPRPEPIIQPTPVQNPQPVQNTREPELVTEETIATPTIVHADPMDPEFIGRVIATVDAIRKLDDEAQKIANIFVTSGDPAATEHEFVLAALNCDRQLLDTMSAIIEAKKSAPVDRAFFILGLDEKTFLSLGETIQNEPGIGETVTFDGNRLNYARKLVDLIEKLSDKSIEHFGAVESVLMAGEKN